MVLLQSWSTESIMMCLKHIDLKWFMQIDVVNVCLSWKLIFAQRLTVLSVIWAFNPEKNVLTADSDKFPLIDCWMTQKSIDPDK